MEVESEIQFKYLQNLCSCCSNRWSPAIIPSASGPSEVYLGEAIPVLFVIFVAFFVSQNGLQSSFLFSWQNH